MAMAGKTLGGAAKALECTEEFVLGSINTERNDSREKITNPALLPYVVLALGVILLGPGLWILASIAFAAYVILTATSCDKTLNQSILLPSELASTSLDEKPGTTVVFDSKLTAHRHSSTCKQLNETSSMPTHHTMQTKSVVA